MKKLFAIILVTVIACFTVIGCTRPSAETPPENENQTEISSDKNEVTKMYITINGNKLKVNLAENRTVDALVEILSEGDIVYTARDFGGFEKVGGIGRSLPADDTEITTQAGDVVLYSSNQIVIFHGSNSWAYTRLGRIEGYSASELKTLLGEGDVQVIISLN